MSTATLRAPLKTHMVTNQARRLEGFNAYEIDSSLQRAVAAFKVDKAGIGILHSFGRTTGQKYMIDIANRAEKNPPRLVQFDSYGHRVDIVEYHPDYHILMAHGLEHGAAAYGYNNPSGVSSHVTRAGLIYMNNQLEPGHCCPIVMTSAAIPVLRKAFGVDPSYVEKLKCQKYDSSNIPISEKKAVTAGMSMTEKQGGSDVRSNTTIATAVDIGKTGPGAAYQLVGHKWFTSAPMCDFFLTLAKTSEQSPPSCFLVPRWLPDGTRNAGFRVMRLKDKCADRANASSEVEYDQAWALMISEEGKGVKSIIEMVSSTRMDCTLGSAAGMKRALQQALTHAVSFKHTDIIKSSP